MDFCGSQEPQSSQGLALQTFSRSCDHQPMADQITATPALLPFKTKTQQGIYFSYSYLLARSVLFCVYCIELCHVLNCAMPGSVLTSPSSMHHYGC